MTVSQQIIADMKTAMKTKNAPTRDLLRVVIGEFNRIGKEVSDEKALAIIKKMKINADEQKNDFERDVLNSYLPTQLSELELSNIIQEIVSTGVVGSNMGAIMGILKRDYGGTYDGKMASTLVKSFLV